MTSASASVSAEISTKYNDSCGPVKRSCRSEYSTWNQLFEPHFEHVLHLQYPATCREQRQVSVEERYRLYIIHQLYWISMSP